MLRGGQPRGDPILSMLGRWEIVCSPLSTPPHTGQQKNIRLRAAGRKVDVIEYRLCVNVCLILQI